MVRKKSGEKKCGREELKEKNKTEVWKRSVEEKPESEVWKR